MSMELRVLHRDRGRRFGSWPHPTSPVMSVIAIFQQIMGQIGYDEVRT